MDLEHIVRRWARRYRWQQSLQGMLFGLIGGLTVGVALAALARLVPLFRADALGAIAAALALAGLVGGLVFPWLRHARTSTLAWARWFDHQFGLADRLSTALERPVHLATAKPELRALWALQQQDAERAAAGALKRTAQLLPFRFAWRAWMIASALCLTLVLLLALPNQQDEVLAQRERQRALLAEQMQQLEQARQVIEQSSLSPEQKARALQAIEQARQQLGGAAAQNPEAALAAMNELHDQLRALRDEQAAQQVAQLQRAGQSLAADELTRPLAEALARGDLEQAADLLGNLITDRPPAGRELSPDEIDRLARRLEQLARDVAETDPSLTRALRQAAQHLRRGEVQAARQALSEAAQSLRATEQTLQQQRALDEAMAHAESARRAAAQRAGAADATQAIGAPSPTDGQSMQSGTAEQSAAGQPNAVLPPGRGSTSSPDVGSDNSIWQPQRLQDEGMPILLGDGQAEQTQSAPGSARPAPEGSAVVPYQQVYRRYAQAADEAINSGAIPLERRELVRRYFSALDPQQAGR